MGKKFMGLGGTDHFWDRAKAWILNQITSAVAAKIAEVVANAPEDLDTLKEIADWIKNHANDAAAMNMQIQTNKSNIATNTSDISALNTQIQTNKSNIATNTSDISALNTQITENKSNIATNTSDISALKTSVAGKADKVHTHSAGDITSGTLPIANGGTGVTTQADINKAFIGNLDTGESDVTDGTEFVSSWASDDGFAYAEAVNTPYRRKFIKVWNYIKGKISSVLGLTANNYGDIQIGSGNITGSKLTIQGLCVSSNSYADANPKLVFKDEDSSQNISLTFTDFDAVQPPASLTLNGNQGNEYFIAPCIKANNKMRIPIGAPSSLEDGCIWIER